MEGRYDKGRKVVKYLRKSYKEKYALDMKFFTIIFLRLVINNSSTIPVLMLVGNQLY